MLLVPIAFRHTSIFSIHRVWLLSGFWFHVLPFLQRALPLPRHRLVLFVFNQDFPEEILRTWQRNSWLQLQQINFITEFKLSPLLSPSLCTDTSLTHYTPDFFHLPAYPTRLMQIFYYFTCGSRPAFCISQALPGCLASHPAKKTPTWPEGIRIPLASHATYFSHHIPAPQSLISTQARFKHCLQQI